jgi:hypothetical protein
MAIQEDSLSKVWIHMLQILKTEINIRIRNSKIQLIAISEFLKIFAEGNILYLFKLLTIVLEMFFVFLALQ